MVNVGLLQRTLATIEAHPESWDQSMWAARTQCGTSYCFAGYAVALCGGRANFEGYEDDGEELAYHVVVGLLPGIEETAYGPVATTLLGLTELQASELFDERNSLQDLREIVARLTAGPDTARAGA
jgi:hypothetical protein